MQLGAQVLNDATVSTAWYKAVLTSLSSLGISCLSFAEIYTHIYIYNIYIYTSVCLFICLTCGVWCISVLNIKTMSI